MLKPDDFIKKAIEEAKKVKTDIPICAIITKNNEIIAITVNEREKNNLVTSHAEILALNIANKKLNSWRLNDCDMYVTLEPCPMCAWAIRNARIRNLYFGSYDTSYGAISTYNLLKDSSTKVFGGIMEKECDEILKNYFESIRRF